MSPVFNEAKYRALLEKLEISVISYNLMSEEQRLDAEFYQKQYLKNDSFLRKFNLFTLSPDYFITDGEHGSVDYVAQGVKYLTAENIKTGYVDVSNVRYVTDEVDKKNARARVVPGSILISIKGTLGAIAVAEKDLLPCNMNRDVAIIKPVTRSITDSPFIAIFLMSKYGHLQAIRGGSGGVQQMITLERLRNFIIPELSLNIRRRINLLYNIFFDLRRTANKKMEAANDLLLTVLGLTNWQPNDESVATKTFADFQNSGRLDAEYYQPKYEAIAEKLAQYNNGTVSCENVLTNAMTKLTSGTEYCYLELADIGKSGEINSCTHDIAENLPSRARQKVKTNDVIVSSVEGSLTSCALITEEYNNAICSTGFHVLRSAEINPETLLLLMKSSPIQALLKQGCSGTILTAILPDALKAIKLPLIRKEVQTELAAKVQESFALRKESKRLLDLAKHAVELAIEQGEDAAMKLLEN